MQQWQRSNIFSGPDKEKQRQRDCINRKGRVRWGEEVEVDDSLMSRTRLKGKWKQTPTMKPRTSKTLLSKPYS